MKPLNLALDSRPLGTNILDSLDYTGLQLYGLEHLPLHQAIEAIHSSDGNRIWNLSLRRGLWDDGSPITPKEYLFGFKRLMNAFPWLKRIPLRALASVRHGAYDVEFKFTKPFARFASITEIPNWVPFKESRYSGFFRLRPNGEGWRLEHLGACAGGVRVVDSPEENLRAYENGEIDFTADTAFPLDKVNDQVHRADTGLFGLLAFSNNLAERYAIVTDLHGCSLEADIQAQCKPIVMPNFPVTKSGPRRRIILAYDAFYPNRQICEGVANHLSEKGWQVELAEDDYYRPAVKWDMKFMILRAMANNDLFRAASLFSFSAGHAQLALARQNYLEVERGVPFNFELYPKLGLGYPLIKIPSLYYARSSQTHPMLRGFV